jgi:hypothetical protein
LSTSPKYGYVSVYEADSKKQRVLVGIQSLMFVAKDEWLKQGLIERFVVKSSVEVVIGPEGVEH